MSVATDTGAVVSVRDLRVHYRVAGTDVIAVNGISFDVAAGETLGIVGESGSGKSTAAMAVLRLTSPPGRIVGGSVVINGEDVLAMSESTLRSRRWRDFSMIPQGSMNSLNPIMRVRDQIGDAIDAHEGTRSRRSRRSRVLSLLETVNLPARVYDLYPHELSGGMKQRVCIAMSIALEPSLIVADEPTSALDVVVQRAVVQTLLEVKQRLNSAMIMIGHDMAMQAQVVDRIAVMFAGNIVELASVRQLFADPRHPYTRHLISSIPSIKERRPLVVSTVRSPDLRTPRPTPVMEEVTDGHFVAVETEPLVETDGRFAADRQLESEGEGRHG